MASGARRRGRPGRRVAFEQIEVVQEIIEQCLRLYMSQKETAESILTHAKIEPYITELVWQRLEEENPEFFNAYNLKLKVKKQITEFNELLEQQLHHMRHMHPTGVASIQSSIGSHTISMNQQQFCYEPEDAVQPLKLESTEHEVAPNMSSAYFNGCSALNTYIPLIGINEGMIKSETAYSNCGLNMYGGQHNTTLEAHSKVADAPVASFSHEWSCFQSFNDPHLDADACAFGFSGQIPLNFSISDLTDDFLQSSDILNSYDRSLLLQPYAEDFLDFSGECKR